MEIIKQNNMPRKILVLIIAIRSNPFEIFFVNIWVTIRIGTENKNNSSIENTFTDEVIIKNQKDNPAVTASALNLGDDEFILYWIDKCN